MELVDTHCHIDVSDFDSDRQTVLQRCRNTGITRIVVPGIHAAGWDGLLALCRRETGLYPALGLHPVFLDQHKPDDLKDLEARISKDPPVAVGEIGLDYFITHLDQQGQYALFKTQLEIARNAKLPVLLHVRKAHDAVLSLLRRIVVPGGIVHAFNGSLQQANQFLDLGFKLGFGGMLSYDRARKLRRLARELPSSAIVLETDAPDMTGAKYHGQRNSPEYLLDYLNELAQIRNEEPATMAQQTTLNALSILALNK